MNENKHRKYIAIGILIGIALCIIITLLFILGSGSKIGVCKDFKEKSIDETQTSITCEQTRIDDDKTCDVIATKVKQTDHIIEWKVPLKKDCKTTYVLWQNREIKFLVNDLSKNKNYKEDEYNMSFGLYDRGSSSGLVGYKNYEDIIKDEYHFYSVAGHIILDNRTVDGLGGEYFIFNGLQYYGPNSDKNDVNVHVNVSEIDEDGTLWNITGIESDEYNSVIFTSKIYTSNVEESEKVKLVKKVESGETFDIDAELSALGLEDFAYEKKLTYKLLNLVKISSTPEVTVSKTIKELYNSIH